MSLFKIQQIIDRNYENAENALSRAYELCEKLEDDNSKSWIAYHLAWTSVNRGRFILAANKALTATGHGAK
jgi:cation transport regulator ChaB